MRLGWHSATICTFGYQTAGWIPASIPGSRASASIRFGSAGRRLLGATRNQMRGV